MTASWMRRIYRTEISHGGVKAARLSLFDVMNVFD